MKIRGIKINNYKSFSNEGNVLRFDSESVLGLIGKNGSGKSNTLLALKDLGFFDNSCNPSIFGDANRFLGGQVSVSFDIEFDDCDFDFSEYNISNRSSIITFIKTEGVFYMNFDGCLSEIIEKDKELTLIADELISVFKNKQDLYKNKLENYQRTFINIGSIRNFLFNNNVLEKYKLFKELLEEKYEIFRNMLPKIVWFSNEMILKNKYTYDDIIKNNDIGGLSILLDALEFELDDLKKWLISSDSAVKQKYYLNFLNKVKFLNSKIQEYYKTSKIELLFNVDSRAIEFSIREYADDDEIRITNVSERSDGLKWYLSLLIKLYSAQKKHKYSLILLDEPGNSLHVIAQKELLKLLYNKENYQIIYTTHSPYMIDINHLENIRLITKGNFTVITNGINNCHKRNRKSYKETITPILEAIGSSLNYELGPSFDKCNLIVEGITDYYYIKSMMNYMKLFAKNEINIIPCIGATNESAILSILFGWGCEFKCLLDNDSEGIKNYGKIKKHLSNCEKYLFFVSDTPGDTIESLLSDEVKEKIDVGDKTLNAKKFSSLIESDPSFIDSKTINNFEKLFNKLGFKIK